MQLFLYLPMDPKKSKKDAIFRQPQSEESTVKIKAAFSINPCIKNNNDVPITTTIFIIKSFGCSYFILLNFFIG